MQLCKWEKENHSLAGPLQARGWAMASGEETAGAIKEIGRV